MRSKFQRELDDVSIEGFSVYSTQHRGDMANKPIATNTTSNILMNFRTTTGRPFVGNFDDEIMLLPESALNITRNRKE